MSSATANHWWQSPLAVQIGGTVIGGLLLLGITGLVGDLNIGELLLYVGVPLLIVAVAITSALVARDALRRASERAAWQRSADRTIRVLASQVRRLRLGDVIHSARVSGWTVEDQGDALVFVSPDDDELAVDEVAPAPETVAEMLEDLAPTHFEATSIPFIAKVGGDAAIARQAVENLQERAIPELKRMVVKRFAQAALADVTAEATANGWDTHWGEDSVYFERGQETASVAFDNIDIARLRRALGLKEDVPLVVEARDGGPGVMTTRWRA